MSEITDDLMMRTKKEVSIQFAKLIAKAFNKYRSSNVYFLFQDAYEDIYPDLEWSDAQAIINKILEIGDE